MAKKSSLEEGGGYTNLLALATEAKKGQPMDASVGPMQEKDRRWLASAIQDYASSSSCSEKADADPIKKLKVWESRSLTKWPKVLD